MSSPSPYRQLEGEHVPGIASDILTDRLVMQATGRVVVPELDDRLPIEVTGEVVIASSTPTLLLDLW